MAQYSAHGQQYFLKDIKSLKSTSLKAMMAGKELQLYLLNRLELHYRLHLALKETYTTLPLTTVEHCIKLQRFQPFFES